MEHEHRKCQTAEEIQYFALNVDLYCNKNDCCSKTKHEEFMKNKMKISEISSNGIECQTNKAGDDVAEVRIKEGFRFIFKY